MVIADMALLLIILTGLVVLRRGGSCTFGLTRVLWKQVRQSSLRHASAVIHLILFNFHFPL
jgi:hypothetical protein